VGNPTDRHHAALCGAGPLLSLLSSVYFPHNPETANGTGERIVPGVDLETAISLALLEDSYMSLVNRKFLGLAILLLMVVALLALPMHAQTNYGAVRGLAKDAQGAVIPDAAVTLTNSGTGIVRTGKTNGSGEYLFTQVDPGEYVVEVTLTGFKTFKEATTVDLGITATVDAVLQVGSKGETVEVQTSEPLVDTASANGGQVVTEQQLQNLPNLGRNPFLFEKLDTGVTPVGNPIFVRAEDQSGSSAVSIAGAPVGANNYVVDGIPVGTSSGGVTFIPSPEAVSDAKIQQNTYDAEIGRTGGGTNNTSLKSGTKDYHGVLYGETRQTPWSANSWLDKHTEYYVNGVPTSPISPRPDITTYLYAGAFGGPLPLSNKFKWTKDTFFWVTEEGYRQAQPNVNSANTLQVPTALEAAGNFSGDPITLYDPTSPFVGGKRTTVLAGVANGVPTPNVIPASYMNSIGSWVALNAFPSPTNTAIYGDPNSIRSDDFKTRSDMYSGKMDHVFAPWWTSNISYVNLSTQEPSGDFYGNKGNFSSDGRLVRFNNATSLYNVFTINPTTIATVGYGFNRYYSVTFPYDLGFNLATAFGGNGFAPGFLANDQSHILGSYTLPSFGGIGLNSLGSYATIGGGSFGGRSIANATHNFVAGIVKTIGKQNLKAGYVYRTLHIAATPNGTGPAFTFPGNYTSLDGKSASSDTISSATGATNGSGLADLEMGLPDTASIGEDIGSFNEYASYHAAYFQDDFRANEKLTINLGLRYEYELGFREAQNQLNVGFDRNITYTIPTIASGALTEGGGLLHGGLAYAGQNGYPIHVGNQSHTKFSPRIGVAYEIHKGTVIQAGFGVFYAPEAVAAESTGYVQSSSYTAGAGGNISAPLTASQVGNGANNYLLNPLNGGANGSIIQPSGNTLAYETALGSAISVIDFNRRDPLVEQYSMNVEHELPWGTSIKLGYVGAHSKNFPQSVNINQLPDGLMAQFATCAAGGSCPLISAGGLNIQTTAATSYASAASGEVNPYYIPTVTSPSGTVYGTGSITSSLTPALGQLLLPYPQYSTVTLSESTGYSLYNGFDLKIQKRASKGLTIVAGYTWSSNWDNNVGTASAINGTNGPADSYNLKKEYARADNDIPNRETLGLTYVLPLGRGQRFGGGMPRILDYAIGGYDIDSITIHQNGGPLAITQSTDESTNYGVLGFGGSSGTSGVTRPNMVPGVNPCYTGTPNSRDGYNGTGIYFNAAAFSGVPAFTYGNTPRGIPCKGPGLSNTDLSVHKTFAIGEHVKIKFIATALNVFNATQFELANTALTTTQSSKSPGITPTLTATGTTGTMIQGNYSRLIQLGGRISF
jgi:hypothetical protein